MKKLAQKNKILSIFLAYGITIGFLSVWWWYVSDNLFLPNIPAVLLGDQIYTSSIDVFGNPYSGQAHYTIPWILRIPQVYVSVSIVFWGLLGFIVQLVRKRVKYKMLLALCVLPVLALLAVGCKGHPEGLDNPVDLTPVEKDMAVEIALGTPEAISHLEQGQEYRTWLHWLAVTWNNSEWSALRTIQYEWQTDPNFKLVPEEAIFYPAVTIVFGNPEDWIVTVAVTLDEEKAVLVQQYPAQKGPQQDMEISLAPIHEVRVNIAESFPPQVIIYIKGGLKDGCTAFHDITTKREDNTIDIEVTTQRPRGDVCPAVYSYFEKNINLGSDFISGETYTIKVNDHITTFVMQ